MSYPWQEISPTDGYTVYANVPFSALDFEVVATLYQPLIGNNAHSLLTYFMSEAQKGLEQEKHLSQILAVLNLGIRDFYQARVRLEGIGLLQTYRKKERHHYVFVVNQPLSAEEFFRNDVFSLLLMEQVGQQTYNSLKSFYQPSLPDVQTYENVTRSFLDVFDFRPTQQLVNDYKTQKENKKITESTSRHTIDLTASDFQWDFFLKSLKSHFVSGKSLQTKEAKELVLLCHEMYGFDELEMQQLVIESADLESGQVDLKQLKNHARQAFENNYQTPVKLTDVVEDQKTETKAPKATEPSPVVSPLTKAEKSLIEASVENSPMAFLTSIKQQKGGYVSNNERYTLEEVVRKSNLPRAVINILIHYVLVVKNNDVLNQNFVNTIANNWAQSGIDSPEAAMNQVRQLKKDTLEKQKQSGRKNYSNNYKRTVRKEVLPKWAQKADKQTPQKEKQKDLKTPVQDSSSENLKEELEERLKRIRNLGKEGE